MQEIQVIKILSSLVVLLCSNQKKDKSFESYMLDNEVVVLASTATQQNRRWTSLSSKLWTTQVNESLYISIQSHRARYFFPHINRKSNTIEYIMSIKKTRNNGYQSYCTSFSGASEQKNASFETVFTEEEQEEQLFLYYTIHSGCISGQLCGSRLQ